MTSDAESKDADVARQDHLTSAPSRMTAIHPAFRNTSASLERHMEKLQTDVTVEQAPLPRGRHRKRSDKAPGTIRVQLFHRPVPRSFAKEMGPGRRAAMMQLPVSQVEGDTQQVEMKCLEVLVKLRTDCLLTLYAALSMAIENHGFVVDDPRALARRRGWRRSSLDARSRPGAPTKRERLREHIELLASIEFVFTDAAHREGQYIAFPMLRPFVRGGEYVGRRYVPEHVVYEFHPLLWHEMTQAGKAFFYDPAILTGNARRDEWSIRLLWYMSSRWGPSWVSKELDKNGGRLTERLGVLLNGADIEFRRQLQAQGKPWLRRAFRRAMDRLMSWKPESLIGGYRVQQHPDNPLEDRVTFWPTEAVTACYCRARSKAIAARDRRTQARRGRRKRSA